MFYILLACGLYSVAILLATYASRHANVALVSLITNLGSILLPLLVVVGKWDKSSASSYKGGLWMAVATGLVIGAYVMALNKAYSLNKLGIVTPIVFGGSIVISTVASYFIYKEKISLGEGAGLILVVAGMLTIIYARAVAK